MGPSRKPSLGGARYMLTIIDYYSRKVWPYFLKHKYDVFKDWKVMVERQTERKVKFLRADNGMCFVPKLLGIIAGSWALSGTTPSRTLLNRMVWLSA